MRTIYIYIVYIYTYTSSGMTSIRAVIIASIRALVIILPKRLASSSKANDLARSSNVQAFARL